MVSAEPFNPDEAPHDNQDRQFALAPSADTDYDTKQLLRAIDRELQYGADQQDEVYELAKLVVKTLPKTWNSRYKPILAEIPADFSAEERQDWFRDKLAKEVNHALQ